MTFKAGAILDDDEFLDEFRDPTAWSPPLPSSFSWNYFHLYHLNQPQVQYIIAVPDGSLETITAVR